jgi:perosamine synthetase
MYKYLLNEPFLSKLEEQYVLDVLKSNWLSSNGSHTRLFEEKFASYIGRDYCLAVQSGTAALHLALKSIGVGKRDTVIIPNYSCGASISSVVQCGAVPVVMDIESDTFGLDGGRLELAIMKYRPKALQLVHVYGYPARDTLMIKDMCKRYGVFLVEDASEALGASLDHTMIGQFGDVAVFSIRSEKMIGVGEGGVVVTGNRGLYEKMLLLASRSAPFRHKDLPYWTKYYYDGEGYNYLLPHLLGAVAHAQMERFEAEILPEKRRVGILYRKVFSDMKGIRMQAIIPGATPAYWLNSILFAHSSKDCVRNVGHSLISSGVEIRSGFWPLSDMNGFSPEVFGTQEVGRYIFEHLLVLPSAYHLTEEDILNIRDLLSCDLNR